MHVPFEPGHFIPGLHPTLAHVQSKLHASTVTAGLVVMQMVRHDLNAHQGATG